MPDIAPRRWLYLFLVLASTVAAATQMAGVLQFDGFTVLEFTLLALSAPATALVTTHAANAQNYNRNRPSVTVDFGNVGIGYRNGYMGNDHNWHRWEHRNDYVSYRRNHRHQYHDWNHR